MSPLNVAVIGYGFSAKTFHLPFVLHNPGFRLHAIVQRSPRDGNDAGKDFPDVKVYRDTQKAVDDKNVEVLVVTSTNDTHFPLSRDALQNGKHVIVEKPFTVTYSEAAELVDLAARKNLQLAVYHNRRWDSDFLSIHALLNRPHQPLGEIIRFRSYFDCAPNSQTAIESKKWRLSSRAAGAGMLFDLGSHLIDQTVTLFGIPETVTAILLDEGGRKDLKDDEFVDDGFLIVLRFKNGPTVELHSTQYSVTDRQKRFDVLGTKGRWIKYGLDCQEDQLQAGIYPRHPGYGLENPETCGTLEVIAESGVRTVPWESVRGGYQNFYQNVHDAIKGKTELAVNPRDAANVMRLIELCRKSAQEGRTVTVSI